VVSWGDVGSLYGVNCAWRSGGDLKHADTKISNASNVTWFSNKPKSCTGAVDLESVMTHEWGHAFGLGDLEEEKHGNLTMSRGIPKCSTSVRTLGYGDWLGMYSLYY
jgi:hypothetical protein